MLDVWQIKEYVTAEGRSPFSDWLFGLKDKRGRDIVLTRLERVRRGNFGDCRFLGKISELRIDFGPGYRVYFSTFKDRVVLLFGGGDKSSQSKDIEKAQIYLSDYRRREDETE